MDHLALLKPIPAFDGTGELDDRLKKLRLKTHATIKKVTSDLEDRFHFNTAISATMELVNLLYQFDLKRERDEVTLAVIKEAVEAVLVLLSPMAPHITEELWEQLGKQESILNTSWPAYDTAAIVEEEIVIVVQINGKLRSRIAVSVDSSEEEIKHRVLDDEKTKKWIEGTSIKKVIVVPQKLVNIVVK
jgi:leucyl-tRNA synthetase